MILPFLNYTDMWAEKLIELTDVKNIKKLPKEPKPWELWLLVYEGLKHWRPSFVFKNIGKQYDK